MAEETIPAIGTEGKYLDRKGLAYFWSKIKSQLGECVTDVEYKDGKLWKTIGETESEVVDLDGLIESILNDKTGFENKTGEAKIILGDDELRIFYDETSKQLKIQTNEPDASAFTLVDLSGLLDDAVSSVGYDSESGQFYYTLADDEETTPKHFIDATPVMGLSVTSADGTNTVKYTQAGEDKTLANVALTDKANTYTAGDQNFQGVHTTVADVALKSDNANNQTAANTKFVTDYVTDALGDLASAMVFRGEIPAGGLPTTGVKVGDTYVCTTAGTYAGVALEVGDLAIAKSATPEWTFVEKNDDAYVTSKETSTVGGEVVLYNGTSGKSIGKSVVKANADGHLVDTTGNNTDLIAWKAITTDEIDAICKGDAK